MCGGEGGDTPVVETLATPTNVEAIAVGKDVTIAWDEVANATSYYVTCGTQNANVTDCTADFTMDDYGTYEISVVAKAEGYNDSVAATSSVITEDANAGGGEEGGEEGEEGGTVTLDFTAQGYSSTQNLDNTTLTIDGVSISFTKGTSTSTQYYANGTSVRIYVGGTMTVTAPSGKNITNIVVYGNKNATGTTFTANVGDFSISNWTTTTSTFKEATWTGNSNSVVFTAGSSKHVRIQKVVVTYN